jgi:hypothetical protein
MTNVEANKMSCGVENKVINGQDKLLSDIRENDVVCEKGRGDHERWPGNKLYRYLVKANKESYNDLTPMERSEVIGKIISTIREKSGWFVQLDEELGQWNQLSEEKARKKVSDDLRREVRRRRERRSNNTAFSAKLKALKELEEGGAARDVIKPVEDPRETDVLFGAGARRHPGNKTYWKLMKSNLDHYIISPYGARSMISRSIVEGIKDQNGRFLEQDPKTAVWFEISEKRAIEKTSHALSNKKYKTRKSSTYKPLETLGGQDEDAASFTTESVESPPTVMHGEGDPSPKPRTKKHRLLQRMEDPVDLSKPITEGLVARPDAPGSPVADMTSDGKVTVPESPPALQTEKEIKENDKIIIISPNESRTGPYDQKDPYHEEADAPGSKRHYGREQAEINEHAYTLADMAAYPMPPAEPRYGSYHPSERYYRDSPSYPPQLRRLSGTPTYRRYMGPEWGPPRHGELVDYVHRARSIPYYGSVSPRISKEKWVYMNEWTRPAAARRPPLEAIPRGHPDDCRSW